MGASVTGCIHQRRKIMGMKYCPKCQSVVVTKALTKQSQADFKSIPGKRRIVHLDENGGYGHRWHALEVVQDLLIK